MQVKVQSCSKETRTNQFGEYTGLKINGQWYNATGDWRHTYNKMIDVDFKEGSKWVKVNAAATPKASSNGHSGAIEWEDYKAFGEIAFTFVSSLESEPTARAEMWQSVMVAFRDGRLAAPKIDQGNNIDDDIPW